MRDEATQEARGLVSCVIIFLDAERFLSEAIQSVLAQSYRNWELILVDDGSTDGSHQIAQRYAAANPDQIRVLTHHGRRNRGKSASRNLGARAAQGEILALLDADDAWTVHKLEDQVALFEAHPDVDLVCGPVLYWYSWTGRPLDQDMDAPSRTPLRPSEPSRVFRPPVLLSEMLLADARRHETICPYPSALAFRRDLFTATGGFDEDFLQLYDDVVFIAKALLKGRVLVTNRVWARYRMHPDEPLSHSYQTAVARGEWHPTEANPAERTFLDRVRRQLHAEARPLSAQWLRLHAILWYALAMYRAPGVFRVLRTLDNARMRTRQLLRGRSSQSGKIKVGEVRWGDFGRLEPIGERGGFWRGTAIRRRYAAQFLAEHTADIRGRVAEIGDDALARRFGRGLVWVDRLAMDALDSDEPAPTQAYDCILALDVLQFTRSPEAAVLRLRNHLAPGGVLLAAVPAMLPLNPERGDNWRFTSAAASALFETAFAPEAVTVQAFGNVHTATAALHGLGEADLKDSVFQRQDPRYPVVIMARAQR